MIPSLVVDEVRSALVEYLASTFALADDDVRDALSEFLTDHADGIFRGPYLRVSTPFKAVDAGWESPLDWLPAGFVAYSHQAAAFDRLGSRDSAPQPTIVTTGTGSGKTECFLYPILDHCARARARGEFGIKALILYPMNALASDQAGRIADLLNTESALAGVTAGLYVGGNGRHSHMGPDHLIDTRHVLRTDPPDILLTNYKMLDFLLLRNEDRELWAANKPDTLQYVVLDEFHTYDGAQGTDVAMLLRRLGATLQMTGPAGPLGSAAPVATSATLASSDSGGDQLRSFASKVFGSEFDLGSLVGETRQSVEEACGPTNFYLSIPSVQDVNEAQDVDAVAAAFCTSVDPDGEASPPPVTDVVAMGDLLLAHPLTRAVLAAVGERPRTWSATVAEIVTRVPEWGRVSMTDPIAVEHALSRYLWLLSLARRRQGDALRPLFSIQVQLWIREVSRVLRSVGSVPTFDWHDTGSLDIDNEHGDPPVLELPAAYCRRCGMSGWLSVESALSGALTGNPGTIYAAALEKRPTIRALMRASPEDPAALWFDPSQRSVVAQRTDATVAVHVTPDEEAGRASRCPACNERDAVRFLGLRVASLTSVSINTMFASPHMEEEERRLLAFTDSVQDASHRASFFAGRTHRVNLRSLMSNAIRAHGHLSLADLGDEVFAGAGTARERFGLVPPDLLRDPTVRTVWDDNPQEDGLGVLRDRIAFEADMEFGLRSRVGRTLELSSAAAATVDVAEETFDLVAEDMTHVLAGPNEQALANLEPWVRGMLERLRLRGAIANRLLDNYMGDGSQWFIWGGRSPGLPPFTPGQGRPTFAATTAKGDFDSLAALGTTQSWWINWTTRVLGVEPRQARELNLRLFPLLASATDTVVARAAGTARVFGLNRSHVQVWDLPDDEAPSGVRCEICGNRHATPHSVVDRFSGTPCLRYRCSGRYAPDPPRPENYYRSLYRSGITRRVVTGEHTGLLDRQSREDLESAFKAGTAPDAPNVLTATPTLEMGIDIGALSAVMLTSVPRNPASYVQRVGRAGRASGNALVTTFVQTNSHGLYYLAEPEAMLAGDIRPPDCYLDAFDTLTRQYAAYLMDRVADLSIDAPPLPREMGKLMNGALEEGNFLGVLVHASQANTEHLDGFLNLFGSNLAQVTIDRLTEYAGSGFAEHLQACVDKWQLDLRDLQNRVKRLNNAIENAETDSDDTEVAGLNGQRRTVLNSISTHRNDYSLSALERLGVLPNYTLLDDGATLKVSLWSTTDSGEFESTEEEFVRGGSLAVSEFAPGNSFYALGHRHVIDALEIGTADELLYVPWRLCPECGFGTNEVDKPLEVCPRCAPTSLADVSTSHSMLRLTTAYAANSEERARVYDEDDDRKRERFEIIQTVDVDTDQVADAWRLSEGTFGAELARNARLRTINLGFSRRSGETVFIAGAERHVSGFTVCAHCGAVRDVRDDNKGEKPDRLHQGWCKVRSGAVKQKWDQIVLYHELVTDAIRLVLPVSMFEVQERLASFKGALLLGLREDFGGDPDHLEVTTSDMPNRAGEGRRNFLVLYDRVPGGTGYLARLADPTRMREILESARKVVSLCRCQNEGRVACHRCLLGVVGRHEYDLVRRDLAVSLLDELLVDWSTKSVKTIANVDIGRVEESELERRFKVALQDWAHRPEHDHVKLKPLPGKAGYDAFELVFGAGQQTLRYRIDEQEGLSTTPNTQPDFLIKRLDSKAPDVAIYLDGFQFHASTQNNNLAGDALKRAGVRSSGRLVWSMTWDDVDAFHKVVQAESFKAVPKRSLLTGSAKAAAKEAHGYSDSTLDFDTVDQNPVELLLTYLANPDPGEWLGLALSACAGAATGHVVSIDADSTRGVLQNQLCADATAPPASTGDPVAQAGVHTTVGDLAIGLIVRTDDPEAQRWTVAAVLPDDPATLTSELHRSRWHDWLQWSNLLQFLTGTGRDVFISTTSQGGDTSIEETWLIGSLDQPVGPEGDTAPTLSAEIEEELELLDDDLVRSVVREAVRAGAPPFVAGDEIAGIPLEASWPAHLVAIVSEGFEHDAPEGWTILSVEQVTVHDLLHELENR